MWSCHIYESALNGRRPCDSAKSNLPKSLPLTFSGLAFDTPEAAKPRRNQEMGKANSTHSDSASAGHPSKTGSDGFKKR
jgi:hypothetical protein